MGLRVLKKKQQGVRTQFKKGRMIQVKNLRRGNLDWTCENEIRRFVRGVGWVRVDRVSGRRRRYYCSL